MVKNNTIWIILDKVNFFFQAEDGIRDLYVTGVQTCALPISVLEGVPVGHPPVRVVAAVGDVAVDREGPDRADPARVGARERSEERRVGKECRFRWSPEH